MAFLRPHPSHRTLGIALVATTAFGLTAALPRDASAQSTDFEVGPWLGWAAGVEQQYRLRRDQLWLNAGFDVSVPVTQFGGGYGGPVEVRLGPWAAVEIPTDRNPAGEGGLTLIVTQTNHASWGTYGVRFGAGHGAGPVTYLTGTLFGGVRYVPARAGSGSGGLFAKATGIRLTAGVRRTIDPIETDAFVFGIEFEPDYFLPPYELFKWGGKH